jgi:hypothetical protein
VVVDTFCRDAKPIYMDATDKMSGATWLAIVELDEKGEQRCGWKPPA